VLKQKVIVNSRIYEFDALKQYEFIAEAILEKFKQFLPSYKL
jgi:hypothetical protein